MSIWLLTLSDCHFNLNNRQSGDTFLGVWLQRPTPLMLLDTRVPSDLIDTVLKHGYCELKDKEGYQHFYVLKKLTGKEYE